MPTSSDQIQLEQPKHCFTERPGHDGHLPQTTKYMEIGHSIGRYMVMKSTSRLAVWCRSCRSGLALAFLSRHLDARLIIGVLSQLLKDTCLSVLYNTHLSAG